MMMNDLLYKMFQPTTWKIGILDADVAAVAEAIRANYVGQDDQGVVRNRCQISDSLLNLEPLGNGDKYLLAETVDKRTCVLRNSYLCSTVEYATATAAEKLGCRCYHVIRIPNTITPDCRSGVYGARRLEFRKPGNVPPREPSFHVSTIMTEGGRWKFSHMGAYLDFEDEDAYKQPHAKDRFTDEMLVKYCDALGIHVYDPAWYTWDNIVLLRKPFSNVPGKTYAEASNQFRLSETGHA